MRPPTRAEKVQAQELLARARRHLERGEWVEAVRCSNRAVTFCPGDPGMYRVRREMIRRFKEACRSPEGLARVVRADPNLVWFYNERFEAQCCWGRFDEVLKGLNLKIARQPGNARALALRGELLRMPVFCRFTESLRDLEKAAALEPVCAWIRAFLGRARLYAGRRRAGIRDLERAARLDAGCGWIRAWLGEALWQAGRYQAALKPLERAVALDPECAVAHSWRGAAYERLGRHRKAAEDLSRALELHRRYAEVYVWPSRSTRDWEELVRIDLYGLSLERAFVFYERSRARRGLGDWDGAVEDMTAAVLLDSKFDWVEQEGAGRQWRGILRGLDMALRENPRRAWTYAWRGRVRMRLGDGPGAMKDLSAAVGLDPRCAWAYAWRAQARLAAGEAALAKADAERALRLEPRCVVAHAVRAQIEQTRGRPRAALKYIGRLLRREPKAAWALCWKGELHLKLGEPRQALEVLDRAVELHPGYAESHFWRAEARRALGEPLKAMEDIDRAISLRPGHALSYVSRGLLRSQLGDSAGLVEDIGAARRLNGALMASAEASPHCEVA